MSCQTWQRKRSRAAQWTVAIATTIPGENPPSGVLAWRGVYHRAQLAYLMGCTPHWPVHLPSHLWRRSQLIAKSTCPRPPRRRWWMRRCQKRWACWRARLLAVRRRNLPGHQTRLPRKKHRSIPRKVIQLCMSCLNCGTAQGRMPTMCMMPPMASGSSWRESPGKSTTRQTVWSLRSNQDGSQAESLDQDGSLWYPNIPLSTLNWTVTPWSQYTSLFQRCSDGDSNSPSWAAFSLPRYAALLPVFLPYTGHC